MLIDEIKKAVTWADLAKGSARDRHLLAWLANGGKYQFTEYVDVADAENLVDLEGHAAGSARPSRLRIDLQKIIAIEYIEI